MIYDIYVYAYCREEAEELIIKSQYKSGSDSLASWEVELNNVSLGLTSSSISPPSMQSGDLVALCVCLCVCA